MPKLERCPELVREMAKSIIEEHESHHPLRDEDVKIDLIFAYAEEDDQGFLKGNALNLHGYGATAIAKILGYKDRWHRKFDAEITIDGDWWFDAERTDDQRRALLDHELHHFCVQFDENKIVKVDKLDRPVLKMRKHDVQVGWFKLIAARNGVASQECIQAKVIKDTYGQMF